VTLVSDSVVKYYEPLKFPDWVKEENDTYPIYKDSKAFARVEK
jgi:hypothetical protein